MSIFKIYFLSRNILKTFKDIHIHIKGHCNHNSNTLMSTELRKINRHFKKCKKGKIYFSLNMIKYDLTSNGRSIAKCGNSAVFSVVTLHFFRKKEIIDEIDKKNSSSEINSKFKILLFFKK